MSARNHPSEIREQWDPRIIRQGKYAAIIWPFGIEKAWAFDPRNYLPEPYPPYCICCPACKGTHRNRDEMKSCWKEKGYEAAQRQ